jgi:hypothetical protein
VLHGELAPHVEHFELAAGERREIAVVLAAGGSLTCTVRGDDGKVPVGAAVSVEGIEHPQTPMRYLPESGTTRFAGMPPGAHKVSVRHDRFALFEREVTIAAGGESALDVVLERGVAIRGLLVDAERKPLAQWCVDLGYGKRAVMTDQHGRFVLAGCSPTGNTLRCRPGYGTVPIALRLTGVDGGGPERMFVVGPECAPSARVRVQCTATDGTPIGGVQVRLFQDHLQVQGGGVTAADGCFEVGPLPPGSYRIYPTHRDAKYEGVDFELKANEVRELPPFTGKPHPRG